MRTNSSDHSKKRASDLAGLLNTLADPPFPTVCVVGFPPQNDIDKSRGNLFPPTSLSSSLLATSSFYPGGQFDSYVRWCIQILREREYFI